jgi:3-phosphoshikimate 1-carboxyvinyltransferase
VVLVPPLSKSDAQRALVLAQVLGVPEGEVLPSGEPLPRDVEVLRAGLRALAVGGGRVDCRDGGAPFRFLVTQAALTPGAVTTFEGSTRLGERPHEPLLTALEAALTAHGLVLQRGTPWPLRVRAPDDVSGVDGFSVTGVESSQFASSLVLGAARLAHAQGRPVRVQVDGALSSEGYLQLTLDWVRRAGFEVTGAPARLEVRFVGRPARWPAVPGDWSSLTYLLLLGWKAQLPVARVDLSAAHPDRAFVRHLHAVGLSLQLDAAGLATVSGVPLGGLDVDAAECPDAVPTLVALAAVLPSPSTVRRTSILRHKESDRVAGVMDLFERAGGRATLECDTLTLSPGRARDFSFDARDDHRLAMAAATLARLATVHLSLHGALAVVKSFPGFWAEAAKAGVPTP